MSGWNEHSFALLEGLASNNEKAWYDAHREDWEQQVRLPFRHVLETITDALRDAPVPLRGGEKTLFRQQRDTRFSADKSPYKTNISGLLTPSGTKAEAEGLLYLQCDVSGGVLGCGFYKLSTAALNQFRTGIIEQPRRFKQVLDDLDSASLVFCDDDRLAGMPRGFSNYYDHDYAQYLKLKQFAVQVPLTREVWLEDSIIDYAVAYAQSCMSLLQFGRDPGLEEAPKPGRKVTATHR